MAEEICQEMASVKLNQPCFYEVFSSDLSSERLKMPAKFIRHMEARKSGSVSLTGPSGKTWQVHLIKQDGALFFHDGWPTFVRDHSIDCGDLLVFRCAGKLHFIVQIFYPSACEKEAAFSAVCSQNLNNLDKIVGRKRDRQGVGDSSDDVEGVQKKIREALIPYRHCKEDNASAHAKGYMSKLLWEEKKVAQSFTSCFAYFVRIMKKFNISGSYTLKIPYQFSMTHLPESKIKIVLCNLKGERWNVNSVPTTRVHTSHTLCGGWMAFVRSNAIKIGDICIFELVRKEELRVYVIGKERIDGENKHVSNALNLGCDAILHKIEGLPKKLRGGSSKVHSKCLKKAELSNQKESKARKGITSSIDIRKHGNASKSSSATLSSQPKAGNGKPEITCNRKSIEDEPVLQFRNMVMGSRIEDTTPLSVASDLPNFVRIMKKFNISGSYTLKFPASSLWHIFLIAKRRLSFII